MATSSSEISSCRAVLEQKSRNSEATRHSWMESTSEALERRPPRGCLMRDWEPQRIGADPPPSLGGSSRRPVVRREIKKNAEWLSGPFRAHRLDLRGIKTFSASLSIISLLERARALSPDDWTLTHTLAEVIRARAETAELPLERARFRGEARSLLGTIPSHSPTAKYATVTRLKLTVDGLQDLLKDPDTSDRTLDETIRDADRLFESARQRYPGNNFVLTAEAELGRLLSDHQRSIDALESARAANPRDPFIASRLASLLTGRGENDRARAYLEEALESNPGDKRLNFRYAQLLRLTEGADEAELAYHYRRSFTKWDENHESQFWFARFAYGSDDTETANDARDTFKHLCDVPMSHEDRIAIRDDVVLSDGVQRRFGGVITRIEAAHGFVVRI